ncbi:bifunctional DNA-formamidopyrimidine glycosylase/DNA-(apurinic or apyrimidinic site) lyase [Ornithinimicrobium sediminis]|uniref:bifunctional DNA-formamidopyrimidine glycosylase/DNA-(apurinic or apyrimidinic site) lyase n=1 Tax=Ornithinimicrobium sediminis TaxID=2904603 RepID=UPI001E4EA9B1|nr:bifunctional DNA-formamidopyrimidine glycosylase/DNA-(apurinic or apyrimidinic site) lyase [Ornithinimicrobium sediminis]MCE0486614.1 bifunctional DNA-formamidopyrimidine glycosylase/DNA-(apurinic or apyrimidinic site) lyase [Ornithinimicrobium sediminis]
MPELPEVEVVRRGLAEHVVDRTIVSATLTGARVARRHAAGPADLAARLDGARVLQADRRGKYLWLVVQTPEDDPQALVVHLGMSGQMLVTSPTAAAQRHLHARFDLDGGIQLRFVDQRTFGGLALTALVPDRYAVSSHPRGVPLPVSHIAADPLEPSFDRALVVRLLKARDTAVKRALLDQRLVSGIGNIYADEALWRAGVHGLRPCAALTKPTLGRILDHAADVMSSALAQGGTSFDALYVNVNGAGGYFDRSLDAYGRTGRPCRRCGSPIRREQFMNRSSHSCPRCQPRPRALPAGRR